MSHRSLIESFYAANGPLADDETLERTFHPDYVSHASAARYASGHGHGPRPAGLPERDVLRWALPPDRDRGRGRPCHHVHRFSATHTGDTFGFPGTGESFDVEQMHLMRFADDGRIVEHWGVRDGAGIDAADPAG